MPNLLPAQSFVALAAVAWADGRLVRAEATALVDAAKKHGLEGDDLARVEQATKAQVSLDAFDPAKLTVWECVVTYALATWLARLDGVQSTSESVVLKKLADRLGLEPGLCERAAGAAFDIAVLPEGGRPDRYDFEKLVARLRERLPQFPAT
jgi:tellurite resistance protein